MHASLHTGNSLASETHMKSDGGKMKEKEKEKKKQKETKMREAKEKAKKLYFQ